MQTRGAAEDAIANYTKALALGADWPAVHFNLGLLYQDRQRFAPAIQHLEATLTRRPTSWARTSPWAKSIGRQTRSAKPCNTSSKC